LEKQVKNVINGLVFAAALILGANSSIAQEASGLKIAVLDMATALLNSEVAKDVDDELQQETAGDQDKVRNLAEQAQALQEKLQQDGEVMSETEQRRIVGELQELQNQYEFLVEKIQALINQRRQQFQQTYAPNLVQAITEVVEEEGYDIVFRAEAVLHYANAINITARVTEKLNQQ
jgi:outer membrane protein|tara:strand:- start:850 stop:1380 length:531 start_codon:yes stop_codon:yes gene_type:complete